jgi:uncharacterized protein YjiS (DUF1127 family)
MDHPQTSEPFKKITGSFEVTRKIYALARLLREWQQRERERRELAALRGRDFGDLAVPPSLVVDEVRRWPWQKSSPQWSEVGAKHQGGDPGNGPDTR